VNSHINRLRSKLENDATAPQIVQTVWGVGYKFNPQGV
jgi:two-component system alkaline phosphatase synthesis response regulator PhoP